MEFSPDNLIWDEILFDILHTDSWNAYHTSMYIQLKGTDVVTDQVPYLASS